MTRGRIIGLDRMFGLAQILADGGAVYHASTAALEAVLSVGDAVEFVAVELGRARVARHVRRPAAPRCPKCEAPAWETQCPSCGLVVGASITHPPVA
jgi:hypothetical protein